ncbi:DUF6716 putative glycosyltransferase [Nonomuraea sp. NPDC047897]|uniref:DUF6716 putative glycosyltransferase n=1 Tax=Nonomuraea sp. NPDC047897 TaxID=3364346 RepID=UPI003712EDD5
MRVLAVADSDSYLKWAAGLLADLPPGCTTRLAVIRTPIAPSPGQIAAALSGAPATQPPPQVLSARALRRTAERMRPDVVLVSCTGPVVDVLVADVLDGLRPRPVFVTGLPGISVPATEKAWLFRSGCDLFVVHSRREVAEFAGIAARLGGGGAIGLARLPFLRPRGGQTARPDGGGDRVVFATQAKVPRRREERERVLHALARLAGDRPDLDVVVKLRAWEDERQTHNERHHYRRLWRELGEPGKLTFETGPMHEQLARAAGFVTVSSTAALEAIAQGVPSLVLADFGVSAEMINLVFEGSGLLGTLDDLAGGAFRTADAGWCAANYFHPAGGDDWTDRLAALVADPAGRPRSLLDGPDHAAARRRARLRVEVPPDLLRAGYLAKRRMRRYLRALT